MRTLAHLSSRKTAAVVLPSLVLIALLALYPALFHWNISKAISRNMFSRALPIAWICGLYMSWMILNIVYAFMFRRRSALWIDYDSNRIVFLSRSWFSLSLLKIRSIEVVPSPFPRASDWILFELKDGRTRRLGTGLLLERPTEVRDAILSATRRNIRGLRGHGTGVAPLK